MQLEILNILLICLATFALAYPLGRYISNVFAGERTWLDPVFRPLENWIYRWSGIEPHREMNWRENLKALLTINFVWFVVSFFVLANQSWLPLNPDANPSMPLHLAFNTAVSFLVNCNLQHYSGESGLSYLGQITLMFLQFVTAGTGMAAAAVVFKAMKTRPNDGRSPISPDGLGNFYDLFFKSTLRILLPLSAVMSIALLWNGTPMNFEGKETIVTLQGDTVQVSRGPAAAMVGIKQIGTNGGGYFGVNSAHPLENPNFFTNSLETVAILLIPMALCFALGFYLNRRRLAWMIFGVMTLGFVLMLAGAVWQEFSGNPNLAKMGIAQPLGNFEGKEIRFGTGASALWGVATTATSNGSVNMMHDSAMPLTGAFLMLDMMMNAFYGGVGVGFLNFYIFILLAVFISGLMVGRTPEFLGKKIEAREMKIAMLVALLHPFLILVGTALSAWTFVQDPSVGWLNNPSFHGFSEMLYEYTSAAANNGSGFEGLGDNNPFWNYTTGLVLLLGRYLPIVGPVMIAGLLAAKKSVPETGGTLPTDTATFGVVVLCVIFIVAALSFFPALVLGPIAEHFSF
jgi:potassium-transporting ATPase potassium-binding subunit